MPADVSAIIECDSCIL